MVPTNSLSSSLAKMPAISRKTFSGSISSAICRRTSPAEERLSSRRRSRFNSCTRSAMNLLKFSSLVESCASTERARVMTSSELLASDRVRSSSGNSLSKKPCTRAGLRRSSRSSQCKAAIRVRTSSRPSMPCREASIFSPSSAVGADSSTSPHMAWFARAAALRIASSLSDMHGRIAPMSSARWGCKACLPASRNSSNHDTAVRRTLSSLREQCSMRMLTKGPYSGAASPSWTSFLRSSRRVSVDCTISRLRSLKIDSSPARYSGRCRTTPISGTESKACTQDTRHCRTYGLFDERCFFTRAMNLGTSKFSASVAIPLIKRSRV
eukprot:RCo010262